MYRNIQKASPYLSSDQRLADVIAAIQATGVYKFYKLDFSEWAYRISGNKSNADYWKMVFKEHPEFFRLDGAEEKVSLILRRQRQKLYNVDDESIWTKQRYNILSEAQQSRFSRLPLTPDEIEALIDVAINLHSRAAERARDKRWWIAPILAFLGAVAGAAIPSVLAGESEHTASASDKRGGTSDAHGTPHSQASSSTSQ